LGEEVCDRGPWNVEGFGEDRRGGCGGNRGVHSLLGHRSKVVERGNEVERCMKIVSSSYRLEQTQ